jgi:hypothetical protein
VDQLCHAESCASHPHEREGVAHERAQVVYCQVVYCIVAMTSCRGDPRRKEAAPGRVDEAAKEVERIQARQQPALRHREHQRTARLQQSRRLRQYRPLIRHVFEHVEAQDAAEAAIR